MFLGLLKWVVDSQNPEEAIYKYDVLFAQMLDVYNKGQSCFPLDVGSQNWKQFNIDDRIASLIEFFHKWIDFVKIPKKYESTNEYSGLTKEDIESVISKMQE